MVDDKPKVEQKIDKEKETQPPTTTPAKGNTDTPVKSEDSNDNTPQNGNSTAAVQDEKKKDTNKALTTNTKIEGKNGNTKPTNNSTATTAEDKNDETSMKEKLLKKKLSQKKIRRTKSGDDSHKSNDNGDKKKKGGEGGDQKKDNDRRGRKRRSSEDQHRRGGGKRGGHGNHNGRGRDRGGPPQRDWPPQRDFGGRGDPYYGRGGPGPRDYRGGGDMYGRGPPGGRGWGDDRGRFDGRRGPPPGRDFDYDQRFGGGGRRDERERDIYGRGHNNGPPPPMQQQEKSRSGSISSKGSRSYSRSRSGSRSYSSRSRSGSRSYSSHSSRGSSRSHSRSYSRSPSRDSGIKKKRSSGSHSRGSRDRSSSPAAEVDETTKDQRTIFVSQLVMRADERDISRYFKRKVGTKVRDVILLRDKRTGRHKGCAYVELGSLNNVERALKATGKIPEFQRFPIMIKRSEAEKNLPGSSTSTAVFTPPGAASTNHGGKPVQLNEDGQRIEPKQVYVGHIDRCVTQAQLYALFSQFGQLDKVILQMDMTTMISKGFGFLTYRDPKDANLAIQTMSGQMLAGKPLKTGWANTQSSAAGVVQVQTDEFPDDANAKIEKVNKAMKQLTGTTLTNMIDSVNPSAQEALKAAGPAGKLGIMPKSQLASVADAALDEALGVAPSATPAPAVDDAKVVGRSDNPSQHILVHNMYNKDEETEQNWQSDIKEDFEEEAAQYGKITDVVVMYKEVGGKIYASFDTVEGATNCAKSLAGRWFDKRQLRVEFVDSIPAASA